MRLPFLIINNDCREGQQSELSSRQYHSAGSVSWTVDSGVADY